MPVTRSFEITTVELKKRVQLVATPESGATDTFVLRGFFEAGSGNPPHHDRQEVVVVLAGRGRYTIGDDAIEVSTGDVVLVPVPTGVIHAFEAAEDFDAIAVFAAGTKTFAPDGNEME
jgi:quercetin dioxygenase-like cupin family protein